MGGCLIYDLRGGIIAATATMGVIVALPDTPMLLVSHHGSTCWLVNEEDRPID